MDFKTALEDRRHAVIVGFLRTAAGRYGVPERLLMRVAWQESRFNPLALNTRSGAQGLMQFMPATAREWHVSPFDAMSAADGAARYLMWLKRRAHSWPMALAAYNWGVGNLERKGFASAPAETRDYVARICADVGELEAVK